MLQCPIWPHILSSKSTFVPNHYWYLGQCLITSGLPSCHYQHNYLHSLSGSWYGLQDAVLTTVYNPATPHLQFLQLSLGRYSFSWSKQFLICHQKCQLPVHCWRLLPMAWSHPSCPSTGCPLSLFSRNQPPLDTANIQSHLLSIPKGIPACKNCNLLQFWQHCAQRKRIAITSLEELSLPHSVATPPGLSDLEATRQA